MVAYLHYVATAVPEAGYDQAEALDIMLGWVGGERRTDRLLRQVYTRSGIDRRYSVVGDFKNGSPSGFYFDGERYLTPSTGTRNERYTRESPVLLTRVARRALRGCPGLSAADVTHVITVSCTGFFAPGPDYLVVRSLGLPVSTRRYHLGFMGCCAALPALRMARDICLADSNSVVLVACLELCSLHLNPTREPDNVIATAVFADGASAAVVSAREPLAKAFRLEAFETAVAPESEQDMTWTIGDAGFEMTLSSYVPVVIEGNLRASVAPLLDRSALPVKDIDLWAVHPGGRAVLDKVEASLELEPDSLAASRSVLRDYGNMSSATLLFIVRRLLEQDPGQGQRALALAFGPGLTVESGVLTVV